MLLAPLALSFMQVASAAPAAPLPDLTLEQSGALRCSVAFGLVHKAQRAGVISGRVSGRRRVQLRVHDACLTSEVLSSLKCDCALQLRMFQKHIAIDIG